MWTDRQHARATFGLLIAFIGGTIANEESAERKLRNGDQSQNRKTHILKATTKILNEKGLQGLSFESVANEAGLSRQLIRYYFSDLDTLVAELCDYLGNVYREMIVAGIVEVGEVERLRFILDFLFDLADGRRMPANLETYDAFFAYAVGSPQVNERLCVKYKTLGQVISQELAIAHEELDVNPLKTKQLTNIRAAGKDEAVRLTPPKKLSLEEAIAYINDDELVEVTPNSLRLRKKEREPHMRKRRAKEAAEA